MEHPIELRLSDLGCEPASERLETNRLRELPPDILLSLPQSVVDPPLWAESLCTVRSTRSGRNPFRKMGRMQIWVERD